MKLVVNMMMGSFMASISEGFSLAEQAGVDQYTLLDILESSALACPLVKSKGSAILEVWQGSVIIKECPHVFC